MDILILSNIIYFVLGIILLIQKDKCHKHNYLKYFYGIGYILIGIISTIYHNYEHDHLLMLDRIVATICIFFIIITKYKNICIYKLFSLIILIILFIYSNICWIFNQFEIYDMCHSLWHIMSAIFIYIIIIY